MRWPLTLVQCSNTAFCEQRRVFDPSREEMVTASLVVPVATPKGDQGFAAEILSDDNEKPSDSGP